MAYSSTGLCGPVNHLAYWVVKPIRCYSACVIAPDEQRLTAKGRATRQRIVEVAAELIYLHGVQGTNNDLVRRTAGISGSQLSHYFPDKQSLVRAVIDWRAGSILPTGDLDSLPALRAWADALVGSPELVTGGCTVGSLASEVLKNNVELRDHIAAGFDRWRAVFSDGLCAMRDRGELRGDADPDQLAYALAAAFQGGVLLAQAARDMAPLRAALDSALAYVHSFATHSY
jgi:TetR/AcrR family transcriptional repressor of nem operon